MPVGRYSLLLTAEKFLDERARPQKSRIESAVERNWDGSDEQRTNVGDGDGGPGEGHRSSDTSSRIWRGRFSMYRFDNIDEALTANMAALQQPYRSYATAAASECPASYRRV